MHMYTSILNTYTCTCTWMCTCTHTCTCTCACTCTCMCTCWNLQYLCSKYINVYTNSLLAFIVTVNFKF